MEVHSRVDYSFEYLRQDLGTFFSEAKDNVRFLTTLERHFKNVTYGASFHSVYVSTQSPSDRGGGVASSGVARNLRRLGYIIVRSKA